MAADDHEPDEHPPPDLIFPFVACKSNGGPYDDEAFVAGVNFGILDVTLRTLRTLGVIGYQQWVKADLIPQVDLLAMHLSLEMTTEPCDEHPDEWVLIEFTAKPIEL